MRSPTRARVAASAASASALTVLMMLAAAHTVGPVDRTPVRGADPTPDVSAAASLGGGLKAVPAGGELPAVPTSTRP